MHFAPKSSIVSKILLNKLESEFLALGLSLLLSIGGILALSSGFDDDDDQDGGGTGSPILEPALLGSPS